MGERKKSNYFTDMHWGQLLKGLLLVQDGERSQPQPVPPHTVPEINAWCRVDTVPIILKDLLI